MKHSASEIDQLWALNKKNDPYYEQLGLKKASVYDQFSSLGSHLPSLAGHKAEKKILKPFALADPYHMQVLRSL